MKTQEQLDSEELLRKSRFDYLNEVVSTFNYNNIAINPTDGACQYSPVYNVDGSIKSPGCAIGYKIPLELANKLDRISKETKNGSVNNHSIFNKLPDSLKELGRLFLLDIQCLHDNDCNWNDTGLSKKGIEKYNSIVTTWKLSLYNQTDKPLSTTLY